MKNLEKYYINFDELKSGDAVWSSIYGEIQVLRISEKDYYPIKTEENNFTRSGFLSDYHKFPALFKSNPFEDLKEEPIMIEVYNSLGWKEVEAITIHEGIAVIWNEEKTNAITYPKGYWREIQPKELTDKERISKLEREVAELKKKLLIPKVTSANDIPTRTFLDSNQK